MCRRPLKSLFITLFALGLSGSAPPSAAADLVFGVVPQQAASRLARIWVPFLDKLGEKTGHSITFATMRDIPSFEACLAQGAYDLAYMNPYHYTVFSEDAGYRAFAHQADKKLQGLMVVRKDADIAGLAGLDRRKVAFPSPAAFGASVLPRAEMKALGLAVEPVYVKSHDSVYRAVAAGLTPAGGGVQRTFNAIPAELRDQLKIIYRTRKYTPHAFAAHPNMTEEDRRLFQRAFKQITATDPALVKAIGMTGFDAAGDGAWDDVRALNLTQGQTEITREGGGVCRLS